MGRFYFFAPMKSLFKKWVLAMLMFEARLALSRHRPHIVAVTGSVGKTSTKDAIFCALQPFFSVRKNEKSYNSDFGIPLTILGLRNPIRNPVLWVKNILIGATRVLFPQKNLDWLVLEVGAGGPGDIRKFATLLSPDIAVVTRFAEVPVHVEFFRSFEAVIAEKTELVRAVKRDGTLVLGGDDEKVRALKQSFPNRHAVLYGTNATADVRGSRYTPVNEDGKTSPFPSGIGFIATVGSNSFPIVLKGVLGTHLMQPVLAAFGVASALELDLRRVAETFKDFASPPGRMRLIQGANNSLIIDDSYNASPIAVREALIALASLAATGRKSAVLGDMAELGAFGPEEHRKIGAFAAKACAELMVVGKLAEEIRVGALSSNMSPARIRSFKTSKEAADALARDIRAGDVVLVKGSQAVRMERIVKALMLHPTRASELLVRQESEWQGG